ncbi:predicted protein [Arabidopsis thaliana]|nr:predicted protein [Arabidopsis thaliana]CAB79919.1 predicted protein [Arabidopsis thaliana]
MEVTRGFSFLDKFLRKRLHCGCIASRFMMELLENGGVTCISCAKKSGLISMNVSHESNGKDFPSFASAEHVGSVLERTNLKHLLHFQRIDPTHSSLQMKQEESLLPSSLDALRHKTERKELSAQPNLSISLGPTLMTSPFHDAAVDDRSKTNSIFQLAPRSRQLLPKPANSAPIAAGMEPSGSLVSQIHVARPPPEGRGKTQLLPRYWPRITDQELLQLSGQYPHLYESLTVYFPSSNSKIIPLFEKVLSASDAGRIGRLVLPKACAEAYFPPISLPEGLPLKIQDIKGKEWVFQFRFWPNNNSRMYVLEGVTPCIQSMQLQAGDTVTFSRTEPEGKLVMGYRKATNSTATQMFKGSSEPNLNMFSNSLNPGCGDINWSKLEKSEDMAKDNLFLQSSLTSARKRVRNIGTKSKRLLIDSVDVLELKITWEEAQELLRPPQSTKPSIFTLENQDFEEYDKLPSLHNETFVSTEFKRRRLASSNEKLNQSQDASALNSLGNAGITTTGEQGEITVAATTKHPRHRAGCSCIVCSQPPSGKGKHKPSCTCTVCEAVKRRFRTLMLRKRNKGEAGQASQQAQSQSECRDETEVESIPAVELAAGENIDLNSDPGASRVSMMRLLQAAAFPLEAYLKQKAISNTAGEQQSSDMVSTEHGSSSAAQETEKDTTNGAHDPVN